MFIIGYLIERLESTIWFVKTALAEKTLKYTFPLKYCAGNLWYTISFIEV